MFFKHLLPTINILWFFTSTINAQQTGRTVVDLSSSSWKLWLDTNATWVNDKLYATPVDIKTLLVNLPIGG